MKLTLFLTAAAAAAALMAASTPADAKHSRGTTYRLPHTKPFSHMTIPEVRDYLARQIWHDKTTLRWLRSHISRQLAWDRPALQPQQIRWFETSLRIATRNLRRLRPRPMATRPAHYQLWLCIHNGEGAWNDETGNGFHGGLQMTYGWDGLVDDAGLLSPLAQMQAAETGYRRSGYSRSWLASQWPNTSPPCLGYA